MAGVSSKIDFIVGGSVVSTFENLEGRVTGTPALVDLDATVPEFETAMRLQIAWRRYLRDSGVNDAFPITPIAASAPYLYRVERLANSRVKYRMELGSLMYECTYKPLANPPVYTVTRTVFDLTWNDYQFFLLSLSEYWLRCLRFELNVEP